MRKIEEFQKTQKLIDEFENLKKSVPAIDEKLKLSENQTKLRVEKLEEQMTLTFQDTEFDINPDDLKNEIDKRIQKEKKNLANEYKKSDEEKRKIEDKIKYFRTDSNIKTITMEIKDMQKEVDKCKLEMKKIDVTLEEYYMEGEHSDEDKFKWKQLYDQRDAFSDNIKILNDKIDKYSKFKEELLSIKLTPDEYKKLYEIEEKSKDLNFVELDEFSNKKEDNEKQENNNKENVSNGEKLKDPNFVELDEFLNKKEDNGKQEKVSENNNPYFDEFNEFLNKKGDKKDKEVEEDKDLKIIAIAGKKNNGFIKYQYVNEETEKTKKTEIYDKKFYKECYNEYRTMGFDNGTVEFDIDALKNVDPLLLKYLERTNPALALEVAEKISNHEDLSEFKDLIKYDMTEADKLTRKEKKLCRKIAKIARKNGLEVKNIEATKGFWGKLLDKILVRDPGDEFLVVPEEIKQLESGESEKEKSTNDFKEQIKQQVKQQLKEERNADVKEKEEISPEAQKNIEKAMENKRENLKELNKDEDEIEK